MKTKGKLTKRKIKRLQAEANEWAYTEFLKLPNAKLPDDILQKIAQCRSQVINGVYYDPEKIVIWLG